VPVAQSNGIEITYETFGNADDPALLLVMGLGCQLILWDEDFCRMLAERGFYVIRFDNRDVGLSSKIEDGPEPNILAAMAGDASTASYTLEDMAADTAGLLDHLGIEAAHVVGVSMGGMIAQQLAISHPERVLSLVSIMSTTGDREVGQPLPHAIPALVGPSPSDREGYVEFNVQVFKTIGSPEYPPDEQWLREMAGTSYDRCHYPVGFMRQLLGIIASPDRTAALANVHVPTLVIHGEADPLITVSGGEATARAIPGAKLMKLPGMGHDLPRQLWPQFVDAIAANAARAQAAAPAASD
jgi:pimeloyl-ACP methyl ester carboxylesterase